MNLNLSKPLKRLRGVRTMLDNDTGKVIRFVPLNTADRRLVNRNKQSRRMFLLMCEDADLIDMPGCSCNHCQNDWDCCGRMVPRSARMVFVKGGVKLVQWYYRNI